jgi:arsenate reductase (thioredoxin)
VDNDIPLTLRWRLGGYDVRMPATADRDRVIFVCTHNSARSQMAEGILRAWAGDRFESASAGTEATAVRPEAVAAMAEIGIDIRSQSSKTIDAFRDEPFDWLVTVCDAARDACPTVPGVRRQEHWSIEDPSAVVGDDEVRLAAFRAARDEIGARIRAFIDSNDVDR